MAKAGASMVQLYTSFGYRGVGTPRLIKDEIASSLQSTNSSWKSNIGSDYSDKSQMGWTGGEDQLRKTSEQLRREAHGLGQLLKDLQHKEDTASLVRAAEEALGKFRPSQPRDNLMGSSGTASHRNREAAAEADHKRKERDTARGMVEDTLSPHIVEATAGPHTPAPGAGAGARASRTITSGTVGGVPAGMEEVLPAQAADLAPIVVEEVQTAAAHEEVDEWTQTVREGQKRLV
jgi:hypothetical protein